MSRFCRDDSDELGSSELVAMLVGKEPGFTRFRVMTVCCTRYFDIGKAKAVLGYEPIVDLNEGVTRACKVRPIQSLDFGPAHMVTLGLFRLRFLQGNGTDEKMKAFREHLIIGHCRVTTRSRFRASMRSSLIGP